MVNATLSAPIGLGDLLTISAAIVDSPWCALGDFNIVIDESESCGGTAEVSHAMAEFREFIRDAGLIHLPFTGSQSSVSAQRKAKGDLAQNVWLAKDLLTKAQALFDEFKDDILLQLVSVVVLNGVLQGGDNGGYDAAAGRIEHTLSSEEAAALILPISSGEIKEAFFDIADDNALGPDGYTSVFFKKAWPEIGEDVCAAVNEFFVSGRLLKQISATVLVLIPKLQMPTQVSDFRPIACCNVLYKAISKILVKRMHKVLHSLIDYSQTTFVPGRSIADNIMLAQELLSGYNQARFPKRCTIKIDIQKAYNSVKWDFLLEALKIFNFPHQFINWIEQCITTAAFSIALNGQLHGFFKGSKGIRQGDPSSPYLFVLVMELFHVLFQLRVQTEGDFQFHWKCEELGILNLCFADDVLHFCVGDVPSVRRIKAVLEEFAVLSGLQANPTKSTVILSKAIRSERQELLDILGFKKAAFQSNTLGCH
ncbi:UNVERIFIED_CONTAM: hypothetical protein Sradi_7063500 [Sesamum radiatum]|uniref:Reverse transcriptase domain-containing protein n=1 Tax=Sesamum radiatum TaxID=300843 RepID=A0AAW2J8C1_SESRA